MISLRPNHPDIARTDDNIEEVYDRKGEYDKAFEFLQKCLVRKLIPLPTNHPDIARSDHNNGVV